MSGAAQASGRALHASPDPRAASPEMTMHAVPRLLMTPGAAPGIRHPPGDDRVSGCFGLGAVFAVTGAALVKGTRCAFSRRGSSAPEPAIAPRLRPRRRGVRLVHQVRLSTAGNCDRDYHRRRDHG